MPRQPLTFASEPLPGVDISDLTGKLIAFEGSDATEVIDHIKHWLMGEGFAVCVSERHASASNFARNLECDLIPALRAGIIVLANGYAYSLIAEGVANGVNRKWLEKVMGFALTPNLICYLQSASTPKRRAEAFLAMAEKNGFLVIDADQPVQAVLKQLRSSISGVLGLPEISAIPEARPRPSARRTRQSL